MRILLLNPWDGEVFPPPSIGYLQSTLKAYGVDVVASDLTYKYDSKDFDIVAVTFHSFSVKHARQIREHYKDRLICGGHHPSAMPEQMLSIGYDQVIVGEGEEAIIDVIFGNSSKIVKSKIADIDSIPFPDYTGLNFWGTMGIPIITSRGCPFRCNFCASTSFWGHKYRMRSVDNVLNELSLRIKQGYKTWMFEDDNYTANKKRTLDICAGISEMGRFEWQCASRAESLDDELCRALSLAGCKTVWIGVESLSQDSLDRCNKNTTIEKMLKGIEVAESHGIQTMSQFLIGIPGDSINNINETVYNINHSKIKRKGTNIVWILPATDIYNKAKEKGFTDDIYLTHGAPFYTYEQNMQTLTHWASLIDRI